MKAAELSALYCRAQNAVNFDAIDGLWKIWEKCHELIGDVEDGFGLNMGDCLEELERNVEERRKALDELYDAVKDVAKIADNMESLKHIVDNIQSELLKVEA